MRLTKEIRTATINATIAATFDKRKAELETARKEFADALYLHEFGVHEKKVMALPEAWRNMDFSFYLGHPDFSTWHSQKTTHAEAHFYMSRSRPMPVTAGSITISLDAHHPFYEPASELAAAELSVDEQERSLRTDLEQILYSVTTSEKLLTAWPKGKLYLPKNAGITSTSIVPVAALQRVNEIVPPPEKAAIEEGA